MIAGRIMSFAGLRYYQQTTDAERAKFLGDMEERVTVYTTPLVFFSLEFNRLSDDHLEPLYAANADLARYRPVLDRMRAMKPYQLSEELVPARPVDRRRVGLEQALRRDHRGAQLHHGGRGRHA